MEIAHLSKNVTQHSSLKVNSTCGLNYWGLSVWKVAKVQTSY